MGVNYAYYYGVLNNNGMCVEVQDTSNYIEDRLYIPLERYHANYLGKYYYPIPTEYGDFNGSWYSDAAHTIPWSPT